MEQPMWTLPYALEVVRRVEPFMAEAGWHVAMGGGVLHRGSSSHDLDIVLVPREPTSSLREAHKVLEGGGFKLKRTAEEMVRHWRSKGLTDRKWVEHWETPDLRRVDVVYPSFIVEMPT